MTLAIGSTQLSAKTPSRRRLTPAGLETGPSRLKMVRVPISTRVGPTYFMAEWWLGANMKPTPASRIERPMASGERSMRTPSSASTSAAPDFDDSARLPCLATGTPAPATTKVEQVEMLKVPEASPPVPTMSIAPAGASTGVTLARMTRVAPTSSSIVSPRTRSPIRKAPIWEGVAPPDIRISNAAAASASLKLAPVAILCRKGFRSFMARRSRRWIYVPVAERASCV